MNETLKDAIEKYLNGDENAFSTIYEESNRYIYANLKSILKNDEDMINDVMQDTYLEISKSLAGLENVESFLPWAKTISTRKAYRALKKAGKYVLLGEDDSLDNLVDDNNMLPEEVVLSKEKQEKVREVINTELTEDEKDCVVGFYYNDMKQKDIAKELDMPENTVKSNIFRAKSKMKKALSGVFVVALAACLLIFALNTPAVKQALRKLGGDERKEAQTKATEEYSEQPSRVEQPSIVEEFGTEIIPEGCEYRSAKTYKIYLAGERFLKTPSEGDSFWTTDYIYIRTGGIWTLKVKNTNKQEYETIMPTIAGEPLVSMASTFADCTQLIKVPVIPDTVTNMTDTFQGCTSLVEVPVIPESVTNLYSTFDGCTSLVKAPVIPYGVTNLYSTFQGCTSLVEAPEIPETVTNMNATFKDCTSLTGDIVINTTPRNYESCFEGVKIATQKIKLTGSSTLLSELKDTGAYENIIPEVIEFYDASENKTTVYDGDFNFDDIYPSYDESYDNPYYSEWFEWHDNGNKIITKDYEYTCVIYGEYSLYLMWKVKVKDTTKEKYEDIISTIGDIDLSETFAGCINMKEAPLFSDEVIKLDGTFAGCTNLLKTPDIPNGVISLERTFEGCTSLESVSVIPEQIRCLYRTFAGCTNLTGTVVIDSNAIVYNECFYGLDLLRQNLTIQGTAEKLADIMLTTDKIEANKNMVEYGDIIKVSCRVKYTDVPGPPGYVYGEWMDVEDREFVVHIYNENLNADHFYGQYRPYNYNWEDVGTAIGKSVGEVFIILSHNGYQYEYTILEIIKSE